MCGKEIHILHSPILQVEKQKKGLKNPFGRQMSRLGPRKHDKFQSSSFSTWLQQINTTEGYLGSQVKYSVYKIVLLTSWLVAFSCLNQKDATF